ncbi:spore protease YyaC [Paenibacillus sp. MY03]|jgi:putative sporulation protein YyaC|uniref:Spore protease YyaC n=1 Tax=Paenibacillus agaridevorans TaxID=171404 RepID=A0A2R5EJ72_9BACL|nr:MULTISPECIES: spore protease YyaC [Paenibacillus]OUS68146.1 spore protease YyaC [Paenibacillus sp. MY03]QNK58049.1 spore protease YyaC [Paenibacillus sp. PAMC21692]GBG06587.1 spore protease YyaC [Paenibacillus agaridevorans]
MKLPFMKDAPFKVPYTNANITGMLVHRLTGLLEEISANRPIVIVCIGTDRSTGDALGPLIGTALFKYRSPHFHLYGTLEDPVHAMNLEDTLHEINRKFEKPFVIGIDACLGQVSSVGCIQIGQGPVKPGAGVNKDLPPVGDIHVTGIVNVGGFMEYFVLQNTRLHLVIRMSEVIAASLMSAITSYVHVSSSTRDQTAAADFS